MLITSNSDCVVNIIRRRENINFVPSMKVSDIGISYIQNTSVSSDLNLFILDKSTMLPENRIETIDGYTTITNAFSYLIETNQFLVTDVYSDEKSSVPTTPLFWKHVIGPRVLFREDGYDTDSPLLPAVKLVEAKILDKNFKEVKDSIQKIDFTRGIIYNNLKDSYSYLDGTFTAYYVQYTWLDTSENFLSSYVEILNNVPAFRVATFDDLSPLLTIINDGRKVYLIEEQPSGLFLITLPSIGNYSFKVLEQAKLEILPPTNASINSRWIVSVSNSTILANVSGDTLKFYIAEFLNQNWNPYYPYKFINGEESTFVRKNLIKINNTNIINNNDLDLYIRILVSDKNDIPLTAFSTNPADEDTISPNGKPYRYWFKQGPVGIRSINRRTGFIDIEGFDLKDTYKITTYYYYESDKYEFQLIDFNPLSNVDITRLKVVLFIVPDTITITNEQTLYYLVIDQSGKVINSNWSEFDNAFQTTIDSYDLYYNAVPEFIIPHLVNPTKVFLDEYSLEGSGSYLVLGEVFVAENSRETQSDYTDIRTQGGGIRKNRLAEAKTLNNEVAWYWDIGSWDGNPYPSHGAFFVEVPAEILEIYEGRFSNNEIKDIIGLHSAAGTYAITKAYGYDIKISSVTVASDSLGLEWRSFPDLLYNVYYSTSVDGPWVLDNLSPLANNISGNSYTVDGLQQGIVYYIFVIGGTLHNDGTLMHACGQPISSQVSPGVELYGEYKISAKPS